MNDLIIRHCLPPLPTINLPSKIDIDLRIRIKR